MKIESGDFVTTIFVVEEGADGNYQNVMKVVKVIQNEE